MRILLSILLTVTLLLPIIATSGVDYGSLSWVQVVSEDDGIVTVSFRPAEVVDGIPVVVVKGREDVSAFLTHGSALLTKIALDLAGPVAGGLEVAYDGPGRILSAKKTEDGNVVVLGVGVDPEKLAESIRGVHPDAGKIVVVNSEFDNSLCSQGDDILERVVGEPPLSGALLEVSCFPPAVAVNATLLEERGYTARDVIEAFKSAGVDGFYLILVHRSPAAENPGYEEYKASGSPNPAYLAVAGGVVAAIVLGVARRR